MDWVHAVERAYVAVATGQPAQRGGTQLARARAAVGAIASHYLAVGTPRTLGLIADASTLEEAALSVTAHRTWFSPREIRCASMRASLRAPELSVTGPQSPQSRDLVAGTLEDEAADSAELARATAGTVASLAETLACDIVCVHTNVEVRAAQLRRGTHVNLLAGTIDDDLRQLATVCEEARDLGALAAGLVDGRQLDELTVFIAGELAVALGALQP